MHGVPPTQLSRVDARVSSPCAHTAAMPAPAPSCPASHREGATADEEGAVGAPALSATLCQPGGLVAVLSVVAASFGELVTLEATPGGLGLQRGLWASLLCHNTATASLNSLINVKKSSFIFHYFKRDMRQHLGSSRSE